MTITTMPEAGIRETALMNYYSAERRAGSCPTLACERMGEFAKRLDILDAAQEQREREILNYCFGRTP